MGKILYINACARPESRTDELSRFLLSKLDGEATEIKLYEENIKPMDNELLSLRDSLLASGNLSHEIFRYACEFAKADTIVIGAPFWDLLFPAVLRTYFEAVSVCGITFRYSEKGIPLGLCKAKKLYYVTTAGGFIGNNNFGYSYVKALSQGLYGIEQVNCFTAEGLDIFGADTEKILSEAREKILQGI